MSSLRLTVAEILTFKVTLSEQNQQNLHFGYFWACIKFYFFFQIPSFLLKLLKFKHIFIFQNFTFVSEAVLELWWSKVSKNANFLTKIIKKIFQKNWKKKVVFKVLDLGELDIFLLFWPPLCKPFFEIFSPIFSPKIWWKNWRFLKLWTIITLKQLSWKVWIFGIWIYA